MGATSGVETSPLLADDFAKFFQDKVNAVRASTASTPLFDVPFRETPTLEQWSTVTSDEVERLISCAVSKTCRLDPAPTWLVKDMGSLLAPFIALLFDKSFVVWLFPCRLQASCSSSTVKQEWIRRQRSKEL